MTQANTSREEFEKWYVENVFNLTEEPVGCRVFTLQWKAWQSAKAEVI